ncbi:hypothetical protein PF003_g27048 [Phytophthora fragariae]|nr:hypothetical protein PF003_g29053 [Phytophthora fragariae]KAE8888853.1 hypothetical protein PF003_g27048 [Phytophthora fragariae]
MINRLIEITGKNFDRQDLDDIQASQKAQFWREVALKYGRDDEDCKGLISDDEAFVGIDPSYIVPHNAAKLEELWSENFVRGQFDVLYLWYWLQLRPEALSNVRGGLYQEDEYDSLDAFSTTPVRERRSSSVATPNRQNGGKKRAERSPARGSLGNKKSKSDSDSMDVLLTLVGRIVTAREAEVALGREQEQEVVVRVRAERHKMLDDIRKRISDIECEMSAAASPVKRRLKGDLDFFLEERQRIMDLVRSQGH